MNKETLAFVRKLSLVDEKNLSAKCLKVAEELGELAKVALPYSNESGTRHRFVEKTKILEEVVDTILASISIAYELEFTDDEIEDMMYRKSLKWAEIQAKEKQVEYPLPYETHITIKRPNNVDAFISTCEDYSFVTGIKLKPIILDLQNGGESVMTDVMTSSKHMGDNKSALSDAIQISDYLKSAGFDVVRSKIETVPWHPAAPKKGDINLLMPANCYFEAHIGVVVNHITLPSLREFAKKYNMHVSKNFFKKIDYDNFIIMITHRDTRNISYEDFKDTVERFIIDLESEGFEHEKVITEFAIYDTNVSHDETWTKNKKTEYV